MATSGTYIVNATVLDIITESLGLIGVYSPGEALDDSEASDAIRTLRFFLKALQPKIGLWLNRELSLFLQDETVQYAIGPTGTHCAENAVKTELAADAASGATTFTIDSIAGISDTFDRNGIAAAQTPSAAGSFTLNGDLTNSGIATLASQRKILFYGGSDESGDTYTITGQNAVGAAVTENISGPNATTVYSVNEYKTITSITTDGAATGDVEIGQVGDHIGIVLDGGTVQWTNLSSALSTTITPIDSLTGAAASDSHVYSYTSKSQRPIEIIEARRHKPDDRDVPILVGGRNDYMLLSTKTTTKSTINQIWYDKQLVNGIMHVWPEPSDVKDYIKFTGKFPIQDVTNLTDNFELPDEWFMAISWGLAPLLAPKYEKQIDPMMVTMAQGMFNTAMASDSENANTIITVI